MMSITDFKMYTKRVMDHFLNPRNVGVLDSANGIGIAGDPTCGDYLKIMIEVSPEYCNGYSVNSKYIKEIKFKAHGCVGAISTSSAITELAKGKHLIEAYKLTAKDVVDYLGDLPKEKIHCSLLGVEALRKAIINFAENDCDE